MYTFAITLFNVEVEKLSSNHDFFYNIYIWSLKNFHVMYKACLHELGRSAALSGNFAAENYDFLLGTCVNRVNLDQNQLQ